ncbi:MAG: hypothetical protein H6862_06490 [Rhodospirillales bacterium]|nr:hypothetical protein [Rhodospirillales bacterium]
MAKINDLQILALGGNPDGVTAKGIAAQLARFENAVAPKPTYETAPTLEI